MILYAKYEIAFNIPVKAKTDFVLLSYFCIFLVFNPMLMTLILYFR